LTQTLSNYFGLLAGFGSKLKLDLIARLTQSIKAELSHESKLESAFGAWHSDETAE
jgi:hypothetical protein